MKNITFSAQDDLIDDLRQLARHKHITTNDLFREWARTYIAKERDAERVKRLQKLEDSFGKVAFTSERKYTRDEMNER